jgi:hypothetical protein
MTQETKWTPGPWEEIGLSVRVPTRGIIATCPTPQGGGVMECFHNTRLIAAAPEMAEALRAAEIILAAEVEARGDLDETYDTGAAKPVLEMVRAALQKVGG